MLVTKVLRVHPDAILPSYGTDKSAGLDVCVTEDMEINPIHLAFQAQQLPNPQTLIPTGLVIIPPPGYHYLLFARSSLGKKYPGLILANSVGVIDEDYSGPEDQVYIPLLNTSNQTYCISAGEKIAQLVLRKNYRTDIQEITNELEGKSRGGFGSTG